MLKKHLSLLFDFVIQNVEDKSLAKEIYLEYVNTSRKLFIALGDEPESEESFLAEAERLFEESWNDKN